MRLPGARWSVDEVRSSRASTASASVSCGPSREHHDAASIQPAVPRVQRAGLERHRPREPRLTADPEQAPVRFLQQLEPVEVERLRIVVVRIRRAGRT
jgi:hypothetical protein